MARQVGCDLLCCNLLSSTIIDSIASLPLPPAALNHPSKWMQTATVDAQKCHQYLCCMTPVAVAVAMTSLRATTTSTFATDEDTPLTSHPPSPSLLS